MGTGQSLAVGQNGTPVRSTTQPYGNLKLSTGTALWPIDPEDASLELVTGQAKAMAARHAGTFRWGLLRDSDPFVGSSTGLAHPYYAVAFELAVP